MDTIKTKQIEQKILLQSKVGNSLLFFGRPGIGKTEESLRVLRKHWKHVICLDGTYIPHEALQGINFVTEGEMKNAPYFAIQQLEELIKSGEMTAQNTVIYVDEGTSLEAGVDQRTLFNIIHGKMTPNGVKLPEDTVFVMTANPSAEQRGFSQFFCDSEVFTIEQSGLTRSAIYVMEYLVNDYIEYGEKNNINPIVLNTLKNNPQIFETYTNTSIDTYQVAVPRTLNNMSKLLDYALEHDIKLDQSDFGAFVGIDSIYFYREYLHDLKNWVSFEDLMNEDKKALTKFKKLSQHVRSLVILQGVRARLNREMNFSDPVDSEKLYSLIELGIDFEYIRTLIHLAEEYPNVENVVDILGVKTFNYVLNISQTLNS